MLPEATHVIKNATCHPTCLFQENTNSTECSAGFIQLYISQRFEKTLECFLSKCHLTQTMMSQKQSL